MHKHTHTYIHTRRYLDLNQTQPTRLILDTISWEQDCGIGVPRDGSAAAICGGRLYVIGGVDEDDCDLDIVESVGPDMKWRTEKSLPIPVRDSEYRDPGTNQNTGIPVLTRIPGSRY